MLRYIRKVEVCPARHLKTARPLPDGLSVLQPDWAPFEELCIASLAQLTVSEEMQNGVRIFTSRLTATLSARVGLEERIALRLTDVRGQQFLLGLAARPFPLVTQEDTLPDRPTEASRTQLTALWTSPLPPLIVV